MTGHEIQSWSWTSGRPCQRNATLRKLLLFTVGTCLLQRPLVKDLKTQVTESDILITTRAKKSLPSRFLQYSLSILGAREAEDHPLCFSLRIGVALNTNPMSQAPLTWHFPTIRSPSLSTLLCHFKTNLLFSTLSWRPTTHSDSLWLQTWTTTTVGNLNSTFLL